MSAVLAAAAADDDEPPADECGDGDDGAPAPAQTASLLSPSSVLASGRAPRAPKHPLVLVDRHREWVVRPRRRAHPN